jgi:hypothetical protein
MPTETSTQDKLDAVCCIRLNILTDCATCTKHHAINQWDTLTAYRSANDSLEDDPTRKPRQLLITRCLATKYLHPDFGHLTTLLGTAPAFVSASLTMLRIMPFALSTAGLTDFSTQTTKVLRKLRIATHQSGSLPANIRAISVKANTLRHLTNVVLA